MSDWPGAVPDFTGEIGDPGVDGQDAPSMVALFEHATAEIVALATSLGVGVEGTEATVDDRIAAVEAAGGTLDLLTLSAAVLFPVASTAPSLAAVGADFYNAWHFDAATIEYVAADLVVPAGWGTLAVDYWWTNGGAGAGDVVWNLNINGNIADAGNMQAGFTTTAATAAAPAQHTIKKTLLADPVAVTPGRLMTIICGRTANSGSDTLANDAALVAVNLRRLS